MSSSETSKPDPGQYRVEVLVWVPDGSNHRLQHLRNEFDTADLHNSKPDWTEADAVRHVLQFMAENLHKSMTERGEQPTTEN